MAKMYRRGSEQKTEEAMGELQKLTNIGAKIEENLNEIGVHTLADLKKMGSVAAWHRIRAAHPKKDCCICALYALEGAIMDIRWNELPEEVKKGLRKKCVG
ncbi:MAG: TfoX/Sxy family protein [Candidatus Peribacteraceae bacterium]|jgi:DNA transformation protein